jgi:T5orf172 domain
MAKKRLNPNRRVRHGSGHARIIEPASELVLPPSEFERRMLNHPLAGLPPRSDPSYAKFAKAVDTLAQTDLQFRENTSELARRLPLWAVAREFSGSGLLMATTLRQFFLEYLNRLLEYGPDSLPVSFNVVESFLTFSRDFVSFDLRDEQEHLLAADGYFDWYANNALPRDPAILLGMMREGEIYAYDMVSDPDSYQVTAGETTFVIAGVSLVRHRNELSALLVAGETPPNPSDDTIKAIRARSEPAPGRESMEPDPHLSVKDRYLAGFPGHVRILMLTRFDLRSGKYDVRYVSVDLGASYRVLTDDAMVLDDLPPDAITLAKGTFAKELARYSPLFGALSSLIYLPAMFVDKCRQTQDTSFKTEFHSRRSDAHFRRAIAEFSEPVYRFERTVKCLPTEVRSPGDLQEIVPPDLSFERDGYWRPLAPGEIGQDKDGNATAGRTWVSRFESWSAESPRKFLLKRPAPPIGPDPGIIYVVRSGAHELEVYKVGLTRRTAEERAKELSDTSSPLPFGVLAKWDVGDCTRVEQAAHKRLNAYRVNPNREFFRCSLAHIIDTIQRVIAEHL